MRRSTCINCGKDVPGIQLFCCEDCWAEYRDGRLPPIAKIGRRDTRADKTSVWTDLVCVVVMAVFLYVFMVLWLGR